MIHYKRLPLEGLCNARDLGGFPAEGGVTRYGVFVRCEVPDAMTDNDIRFLKEYGVVASLDLRGEAESHMPESRFASLPGHRYVLCPMMDAAAGSASGGKPPKADYSELDWAPVYIAMSERGKDWIRRLLEEAANCEGCLLYHCFTGKDRTGVFTALLLGICGVDKLDIMVDYSESMVYLHPFYDKLQLQADFVDTAEKPDYSKGFYRTAPETIERLLDYWEEKYGSLMGYVEACGVSPETVAKIREKLIEKV